MMSKSSTNIDSTGAIPLAQFPPQISLDSALLSWLISLPTNPLIVYAVFTPTASVDSSLHLSAVEAARRSLAASNSQLSILDSLLPSVQINQQSSTLYVFAISSTDAMSSSHSALNSLSFDNLLVSGPDAFTPHELYPCSPACSTQRNPCPMCLNPQLSSSSAPSSSQGSSPSSQQSTDCLLPRRPLREAYSQFLCSIRDHLIQQITDSRRNVRSVTRYADGFLLGSPESLSEWGVGWDHHAYSRTVIRCRLDVHLSPTRLTIHPVLRLTNFLPLLPFLPVPPGTPIKLLPYGAPGYYLTTYSGPTSVLTGQFEASLTGLGAGDWKSARKSASGYPPVARDPTYVIAWVSVQNKQGEDKGIVIIWPASLCLYFLPSSPQAKRILSYIPELPTQLQPSPQNFPSSSGASATMPTSSPMDMDVPVQITQNQTQSRPFITRARVSPTSDSLHALRALTISKTQSIYEIAQEVSSLVDSVAKERERERERIRKEREQAQSPPKPVPALRENAVPGSSVLHESLSDRKETVSSDNVSSPLPLVVPSDVVGTVQASLQMEESADSKDDSMVAAVQPSPTKPVTSQAPAASYDPFTTFDASWSRSATEFNAIDMDYDMGFGINMNPLGVREGGGGSERFNMDIDDGFGAFTDDDFSFFDRPAGHDRPGVGNDPHCLESNHIGIDTGLISTARFRSLELTSPLFSEVTHGTGPGPPSATPGQSQPSPWTSGILGEGFTPRFSNVHVLVESTPRAPELVPSSPTFKTPSSHSVPPTPAVHVAYNAADSLLTSIPSSSVFGPTVFDPIAFASSHRMADDKYAFGKFALPSPPDEEDRTESMSSFLPKANGWKTKYNAITDPRVSVVRKLIGAKRKSIDQGGREEKMSPSWVREQEEWQSIVSQLPADAQSDLESDDEEDILFEEDDAPMGTNSARSSTPSPSYLPLGPSLLATQFHHSHLLLISTALRPPGAAVAATNLATTGAPISVPTPVSPPAILGEKSRSLEVAATMLAKEVVENCVWAESYRLNQVDSKFAVNPSAEVCQADVKTTVKLLDGLKTLEGPLNMRTLFSPDSVSSLPRSGDSLSLHAMDPPLLSVGKSDVVIEILPPALRFWEKLGLTPRGGAKNVTAYVFFEEQEDKRLDCVSRWLDRVSTVYSARNFGTHVAGTLNSCSRDGVIPIRFDSFRKTLPSLITDLPPTSGYIVFYIATPAFITTLTSPVLRQVFSAAKRASRNCSDLQILFQFVSESMVLSSLINDPTGSRLGDFVSSVYDRILKPVDRSMSHRRSDRGEKVRRFFQDPAFVLGRPRQEKVVYTQQAPVLSLDVLDRHTLLHVGYRISSCSRWLFAVCVDQRGENHELGVWLTQHEEGSLESFLVGQLWNFAINVAKGANVEWRIVFSKLGIIGDREMDAWITKLGAVIPACEAIPMMHVTLVSAELDTPWTFIAPALKVPRSPMTTPQKIPAGTRFEDISATTYALLPPAQMTLSPVRLRHGDAHFVADHDDAPTYDTRVRALSTAAIIRVPADTDYTSISMLCVHMLRTAKSPLSSMNIADEDTLLDIIHNFHELAVLAKVRWKLNHRANPILPFHLAALEVIDEILAGELPSV